MTIKSNLNYISYLTTTFFEVFIKYNWEATILRMRSKHKEEKSLLRNDLKRWTSHRIHRTHVWYRLKISNIISHSVQVLSPQCPHKGQSAFWTFSVKGISQSHNCEVLVFTKFIYIMNQNPPSYNFDPLVIVLELHTHTITALLSNYALAIWSLYAQSLFKRLNKPVLIP